MENKLVIFWFRRDLRLSDNRALHKALQAGYKVLPIFIFDTDILDQLEDKQDRRLDYIQQALAGINGSLQELGSGLKTFVGKPLELFASLLASYPIAAVYCNRDYEPQAIARDRAVYDLLAQAGIALKAYKDQVIFDRGDVLKSDGKPYTVFTPYARKWKALLQAQDYAELSIDVSNFFQFQAQPIHSLADLGFQPSGMVFEKPELRAAVIDDYDQFRDFPALGHTTLLGTALRFGTISIRQCVRFAAIHNQTWLSELIWREFFMQILYHFPAVVQQSFKSKYDYIAWRNNEAEFRRWCAGDTGYPIVDAGMRELNQTGFMHNRVRMIVASFLCKHLLIDWRWGEAYFASKLNDYDLAANNGNWQWAAGCGCDAAPYFRVFNPTLQMQKFDKGLIYSKKWVPELGTSAYPGPMVDHAFARERALATYAKGLSAAL